MVDEIVGKYAKDERVIVWDIFNEIGNSRRGMLSVPWMERFFEIARSQYFICSISMMSTEV